MELQLSMREKERKKTGRGMEVCVNRGGGKKGGGEKERVEEQKEGKKKKEGWKRQRGMGMKSYRRNWLISAGEISREVEKFIEDEKNAKKSCFFKLCLLNDQLS